MPAGELRSCHALVTGAGGGIGRAIAVALSGAGAKLSLMGRTRDKLEATRNVVGQGFIAQADVTDEGAFTHAIDTAEAEQGPLSILVNNAGAVTTAPISRTTAAAFQEMLSVNLASAFFACRKVLPAMMSRGSGRIVNIASTAGLKGYAYVSAYCAAKHGLVGLTRALALEAAGSGVTVNAVCPGYTDTELVTTSTARVAEKTRRPVEAVRAQLAASNPLGRLMTPEEVADAVLWLCKPTSAAITGQAIAVAGGEVM